MKEYIIGLPLILILVIFLAFQFDNDQFVQMQEFHKRVADDCADAASLYYDEEEFSEGIKIFKKDEGNKAIAYILKESLNLKGDLTAQTPYLKDTYTYYTYYFDGDGTLSQYKEKTLIDQKKIEYPYNFREERTGYEKKINFATVIVTVDAGKFDYRLAFINKPRLIRTSGYEYWNYN